MDDSLGQIDIEGKNLAVSTKEIEKLMTEKGCELKMVPGRVYNLDETVDSDVDADNFLEDEFANKLQKQERWKKEYVSLVLNANRDPVKPGKRCRFAEFQEENMEDLDGDFQSFEHKSRSIHKMYENIGPYEEYMTTHEFEEISPGKVFKRKILPGVDLLVQEKSLVMYNCALWTENSRDPFDSTWLRKSVYVTNLATDSVLPGIRDLLLTMKKGETSEALIRPEAGFGPLGAMPRIPANATLFCIVEVVKVVTEDKMSILTLRGSNLDEKGLTFEDCFTACDVARQRGNYYFERAQFRAALQRYKSGIRLMESLAYKNEQEESQAKCLLIKLHNNCARAANAAGYPRLALSACKRASEIDDMVPKTYWLRMSAWKKRGHLDSALGVARRAMQLFPEPKTNRIFSEAVRELKSKIDKEKADLDELHRLMGNALLTSSA